MKPVRVRAITIGEGMPKICAPIVGKTVDEIKAQALKMCDAPIDMVEWRADFYEDVFCGEALDNVLTLLRDILGNIPLLFTFRTAKEGGEREIDGCKYRELLAYVASSSCVDLLDVEIFFDEKIGELICELREQTIILGSNHDFEKTPSKDEIVDRLDKMREMGAHISKIALMPKDRMDVFSLLAATYEMQLRDEGIPVVAIAMSELGLVSRVCGEFLGSAITFGSVGEASAPGQIAVGELREMMEMIHLEGQEKKG